MALFKPTLVKQAKEMLREYPDPGSNGIAIHVRKGMPLQVERGPCHGFVRNTGVPESIAIVSLLVRGGHLIGRQPARPIMLAYYDWLFNRSPWAFCFKYKSAANALDEKSCVVRADVPANLMQGALISTRHTWEYAPNIKLWYDLVVKHGMNEHEAFLASFFVSFDGNDVAPQGISHDHVGFSSRDIQGDGIHAFLNNTPLFKRQNFNEGGEYNGVHRAWQGKRGKVVFNILRSEFDKFGKTSVTKNPFTAAKPKQGGSRRMNVSMYATFAKEFFGKYREISYE